MPRRLSEHAGERCMSVFHSQRVSIRCFVALYDGCQCFAWQVHGVGDCINQCPVFDHFARAATMIDLRFIDRDANSELRDFLSINAGEACPGSCLFK